MKTFTLSLLLSILYYAAGAQCAAPVVTASGPTSFCPGGSVTLSAPTGNVWTQKAGFGGIARKGAVSFSIGSKGYIGTGSNSNGISLKDFWEYNPATGVWTQKANFGGAARVGAVGFSIGSKGYIGTGADAINNNFTFKDFWEYDPVANAWTQKADFGGGEREYAVGFSIGSKGYLGTGDGGINDYKDFWEYDPATDKWTQKTNFGGVARNYATGFSIGSKGYIGTGYNGSFLKDFWEYNPATDAWTQKTDFGGVGRIYATGFSIGSKGYIGTGLNNSFTIYKDFWEYNPATDAWTQKADFGGTARLSATGFSIGSRGYIGTGDNLGSSFPNDFWEYDPGYTYAWSPGGQTTSSITATASGNYTVTTTNAVGCSATSIATVVTVNTPATPVITASGSTTLCPGGSITLSAPTGNVWIQKTDFGGSARDYATSFSIGSKGYIGVGYNNNYLKDFWEYDPATNVWTQKANFGGTARLYAVGFSIGNKGYIGTGYDGNLERDFWEYNQGTNTWTRKADFGGSGRLNAVGFSIGNKGYIGTGNDNSQQKDFWEYDPATDVWTRRADFGGVERSNAIGLSIGSKGYIGLGVNSTGLQDFWEYNPGADTWTRKADFDGYGRINAAGFSIGNKGYIGTGHQKDFWEYDPLMNIWTRKADFGGTSRYAAVGFSIGSKGYIGTGNDNNNQKDFWEYTPDYTYFWSPGSQTTSSIGVTSPGNYTVTTTNALGCSATSAVTTVTVVTPATPAITASGSTTFCSGSSVTLTSSSATTYQWYLNNTLISGATSQSYTASGGGNYTVTTTSATGCSATSAATAVTVNPAPATPVITASGSTALCSGSSVTLTSSVAATTYQWYLNGAVISGAVSQSYTASAFGGYTVSVTNASGCSAISAPLTVTVNTIDKPSVTASGATALCSGSTVTLSAPVGNTWAQKADFGGTGRDNAAGFSINNKGYIGTGFTGSSYLKDFWQYDPATDVWTQKADFGGSARYGAVGFSIGNKGYMGTGFNSSYNYTKDFWEYDPSANTWAQKADFGGGVRSSAVGFSNGSKGYIGTGYDGSYKKDFWEYNPTADTWTQKTDFGGTERLGAVGFSINNKGYIGTGNTSSGNTRDFWEYNPAANIWIQKADFGGTARYLATGFSIGSKGYIGTGYGAGKNDLWEYDQAANTWTQKTAFPGADRSGTVGFSIGNKGYIGTGQLLNNSAVKDFYEFVPDYTYLWSPGGQTTSSVTPNTTGNYTVTLTNAWGCSATSDATPVTIYPAGTIYVDAGKAVSGDGSSWANAYKDLKDALYVANQCSGVTTINVARGTYKPVAFANPDSTFGIYRGGLKIYGGYPSGGGVRNAGANPTILSGEIGTAATTDNSYHILVIAGLPGTADSVVVDGFTFTGGNATGTGSVLYNGIPLTRDHGAAIDAEQNANGKLAFRNLTINNNTGGSNWGGALVLTNSNATLDKCIFYGNSTNGTGQGGAMWNNSSTTTIANSLFYNNYGAGLGGAIQLNGGNPLNIINSTFYANRTSGNGGAIRSGAGSVLNVSNTIFYKNDIGAQNGTYIAPGNDLTLAGSYTVTNSMLQGAAAGYFNTTTSIFGGDPLFTNENNPSGADNIFGTADDGLRLQAGSPASNTGNNNAIPAGSVTDLTGAARIQNGTVDMGAYEGSQCPSFTTLYVDNSVTTAGNGSSWTTAFKELRDALSVAQQCPSVTTINVAKGTYLPTADANRDSTFLIYRGGLKVYGGYPSGGGVRNTGANPTMLSGEIGTAVTTDNSYHILVIAGLASTADSVVIDGFTFAEGNAGGTGSVTYNGISVDRNHGAAIDAEQNSNGKLALRDLVIAGNAGSDGWGAALVLSGSNATLDKCIFSGNSTSSQGGAMWNNGSTTRMTNCLLYNNYGAGLGGAVQLNGGNPLTIINSTFYANRTGGNGAAIRSGAGSVLNLSNTIFYKNDIGTQNGAYVAPGNDLTLVGTYTITNCLMQGPATGYSGAVSSVFGSDPLFANETSPAGADNIPGTADDGLRLQAGSPAINAGSNAAAAGIASDITGAARIQNGTVDMGAYENAFTPLITYYPRTTATDLSQVSNWTTDVAGGAGGTSPSNFTSPNQLFNVNGNLAKPSVLGAWTISGGSSLVLNNTDSLIFRPTASLTIGAGSAADFNGKSVTLKSTAAGTAFIGQISGSLTNASNVTVERYLSSSGNRAYRLLTPSVNTTTSIHANWQEGATSRTDNPRPGYGTHITGDKVDQTGGFDATATGEGSLFTVSSTAGYQYIPNTNATTFSAKSGYLIYIRGDRSIDLISNATPLPSTNTTLRATGTLLTGNQVFTGTVANTGGGTGFNLVTNPYASPISWTSVYGANTGLTQFYTLFDPNVGGDRGGYVTVNTIGIKSNPASNATTAIQSGQAFFVQASGAAIPTVTIQEAHKSTVNNVDVFRTGAQTEVFTSSLFYTNAQGQRINADGVTSVYNNAYDTAVDGADAEQIANFDEDIAIRRSGHDLSIESRPLIDLNDTIPFAVARLQTRTYEWEFSASNFNAPGLKAFLLDRFLNTQTPVSLSGTTVVSFAVTSNAASFATNRFSVVFAQGVNTPLPLSGLSVKAYQKSKDIQVEWTVQTETGTDRYEVEKSADARQFSKAATMTASNAINPIPYNWLDVSAAQGSNYYRIKAVGKGGEVQYSKVVRVDVGKVVSGIAVYPNPVTDNVISLMVNLPKGKYTVTLSNALGQRVYQSEIVHPGGSATQPLRLAEGLAQGMYQLSVSDGKSTFVQQVIKQQ